MGKEMNENIIGNAYHRWYYDTGVWQTTTFLGLPCLKSVSDMWGYQEIITNLRPALVIEFGTFSGASALYFLILKQLVNPVGMVLSVDIDHSRVPPKLKQTRGIEFITDSSTSPAVTAHINELTQKYPGPIFAILDSDHSKEHVYNEMLSLRSILKPGDYLIVEDSNINGHPVYPEFGAGPMEAIISYQEKYPDDYETDIEKEEKFGFTFAPNGFLIRK